LCCCYYLHTFSYSIEFLGIFLRSTKRCVLFVLLGVCLGYRFGSICGSNSAIGWRCSEDSFTGNRRIVFLRSPRESTVCIFPKSQFFFSFFLIIKKCFYGVWAIENWSFQQCLWLLCYMLCNVLLFMNHLTHDTDTDTWTPVVIIWEMQVIECNRVCPYGPLIWSVGVI
jgi:hypothetical protein